MLVGTHILAGVALWELSPRKLWMKIPVVVGGGYLSHYVLDSMATYQRLRGDEWAFIYSLIQALAVLIAWWVVIHRAKHRWDSIFPPAMLSGLWAFLCWDYERVLLDKNYIHWAYSFQPRYLGDCSANPWTGLWEVALVAGLLVMLVGDGGLYLSSLRQIFLFFPRKALCLRHRQILPGSSDQ